MAKSVSDIEFATTIVRRLQQAGHTAYFAGGCVRDQLLGRTPADFDVATSAHPEQVMTLFGRAQQVGVSFGVVLVRQKHQTVEVATFRTDGQYSDGRRPDNVQFTTAEVDAQRRDFTCNGLFFDPIAHQLHDFVGGQADIQARILRAIGRPEQRFAEDYLRMLRAPRFAAKLGFEIEPVTLQAIRIGAPNIRLISKERIGEELRMMLAHPARVRAAELLVATGLLAQIWPTELLPPAPVAPGGSPGLEGPSNLPPNPSTPAPLRWPSLTALSEPV
ncbi:MAG: CCA tRNA nucleotidyltransferase, partial [Phycisphaerae bacterium]